MLGRPIRLMTTTVVSALAVAISAPAALACYAGCAPSYSAPPPFTLGMPCGSCGQSYAAPPAVYGPPPVVYAPAQVGYAPPCGGCYAPQPAYRVDLGPTYQLPVASVGEPVADEVYPRRYPYAGRTWAYRHAHRDVAAVEHVGAGVRPVARVDEQYGYEDYGYRAPRRTYGVHEHRVGMTERHRARGIRLAERPMPLRHDVRRGHAPVAKPHHPDAPQLIR